MADPVDENLYNDRSIMMVIRKTLEKNDELSRFKRSFSLGEIGSGRIYTNTEIIFKANGQNEMDVASTRHATISILKYSPRDMATLIESAPSSGRHISHAFYTQMYNDQWDSYKTSKKVGLNVCKKINIKGYCLNFSDVKKYIDDIISNSRYHQLNGMGQLFYVSRRNILLGLVQPSGTLLIRRQCLEKMLMYNTQDQVTEALENLLVCYLSYLKKFEEVNIREYKKEVLEVVEDLAISSIVQSDIYGYRNRRTNTINLDDVIKGVKSNIEYNINQLMNNNIFGAHDNYSYQKLLESALSNKRALEASLYQEAFKKGMQIGLKLEMLGWRSCAPNFSDHSILTDVWWGKEVDIKPDSYMKGGVRYLIPKDHHHIYRIKMLYVNQDGMMRCDGKHPNVQGTKVCMGDLKVCFTDELSVMQETFQRIETLLDMINYDSAYDYKYAEEIQKVGIEDNVFNDKTKEDKKKNNKISHIIKEVSFGDDSDVEEFTEVPTQNQEIKYSDDITLIQTPLSESIRLAINETNGSDANRINDDAEIPVPVSAGDYYQIRNRVESVITYVDADGNTVPVNEIRQVNQPNNVIPVSGLSLGDSNIRTSRVV